MIDVYMWSTTNSRRATVGLEEAGLQYTIHPININEGEQKTPEHTARNPYQKVPVIIDSDGPGGPGGAAAASVWRGASANSASTISRVMTSWL